MTCPSFQPIEKRESFASRSAERVVCAFGYAALGGAYGATAAALFGTAAAGVPVVAGAALGAMAFFGIRLVSKTLARAAAVAVPIGIVWDAVKTFGFREVYGWAALVPLVCATIAMKAGGSLDPQEAAIKRGAEAQMTAFSSTIRTQRRILDHMAEDLRRRSEAFEAQQALRHEEMNRIISGAGIGLLGGYSALSGGSSSRPSSKCPQRFPEIYKGQCASCRFGG